MDLHNPLYPNTLVLAVAAICAVTDARSGRIYNAVTVPAIVVGLVWSVSSGDRGVIAGSLAGLALGLVPFGLAASRGWVGGGDVKLFAAIGALGGFFFLMDCLFVAFVLAALYGLLLIVRHGRGTTSFREFLRGSTGEDPRRTIRMGVFVFVGALVCVLWVSTSRGG